MLYAVTFKIDPPVFSTENCIKTKEIGPRRGRPWHHPLLYVSQCTNSCGFRISQGAPTPIVGVKSYYLARVFFSKTCVKIKGNGPRMRPPPPMHPQLTNLYIVPIESRKLIGHRRAKMRIRFQFLDAIIFGHLDCQNYAKRI